jgi:serine protease Do
MKRSLVMCLSALLACSSVAMASLRYDYNQQTPERPRRVELPSFLGVELSEVSKETVARLKLREERGALVEGVTSGSSAAQAGLQKNDVIVKWDGEPIESAREMSRHIRETPAGRAVRLNVMRDGREVEVNVTLGERAALANRVRIARPAIASVRVRPDVQVRRVQDRGHLGVELQSMTPQLAEYFGLSKRSGALVIFVFADSPASKAGLKAGDVILSAGGETVENPMDVRRVLTDKSEGVVELKILRDKQEQTLRVQIEKGTGSWLLAPDDCADTVVRVAIAPMAIQLPKIKIAPMAIRVPSGNLTPMAIRIPKINVAPEAIAVPRVDIAPMDIQMPKIEIAPIAIPAVKIDLAPMKVEVPKIRIPPIKVVSPGRVIV